MKKHNENSRVKIPALVHLTRLGYEYLSLKEYEGASTKKPTSSEACFVRTSDGSTAKSCLITM